MPIPTIGPYPMPADLPANQVPWWPDTSRALLLVHDMQRYFLNFFRPRKSPYRELVGNIGLLISAARSSDVPVAYTAQPGGMSPAQRGLLCDFWGPGMTAEPEHNEIIGELAPESDDVVITKWRYSAFHRTGLLETMRKLGRDQLLICGVYAHVGCMLTACDAFSHDVEPFLVADAVADFSLEDHRMALTYAVRRCASVLPTVQVLGAVRTEQRLGGIR
ncbi:isochorismatase family protein [Phytoactinopolyspora limicola]|uniref:isochorismatase family protein n=1 Tax=Phytoactinopolyspora limicola TaxID=2715536 RepID=UPI00140B91BB|nr:isochorismatase family protein [Phytoactinopolyspora limicola]